MIEGRHSLSHADTPRVSVIIPTYNNTQYIRRAVESIFFQTYTSYEVIVIDDGSTDDTSAVLLSYGDRIQYVFQENKGVSAARNHGIRVARGEFVCFLDADDYFLPDKLAQQVAALECSPSLGIIHSGWRLVSEEGRAIRDIEPWRDAPKLNLKTWLLQKPVFLGPMMIRRHWLKRVGGFDTALRQAEDVDLLLRLSLMRCTTAWLYKPTVCYRQHTESTMQNGPLQAESINRVLDNFFARSDLPRRIRRIENTVRYYTLMWIVRHLYRTRSLAEIPTYLGQSLAFTGYPPIVTALHWLGHFARLYADDRLNMADLRSFLPYVKEAIETHELSWQEIESSASWWVDVWWNYLNGRYERGNQALKAYHRIPALKLLSLVQSAIVTGPTLVTEDQLAHFWEDAKDLQMTPPSREYEAAALYLMLFARSVLARQWDVALKAIRKAVRTGHSAKAAGVWSRFAKNALRYYFGHP